MFSKSQRRHSNHRLGPFGGNPGTTEMLFQGVEQGRGEEERPKDCLATRNRVSELAPSSVGRAGPSGPLVPVARHGAEADQQQAAASRAESDSGGGAWQVLHKLPNPYPQSRSNRHITVAPQKRMPRLIEAVHERPSP